MHFLFYYVGTPSASENRIVVQNICYDNIIESSVSFTHRISLKLYDSIVCVKAGIVHKVNPVGHLSKMELNLATLITHAL